MVLNLFYKCFVRRLTSSLIVAVFIELKGLFLEQRTLNIIVLTYFRKDTSICISFFNVSKSNNTVTT
jgi:hypothetical protein